MITITRFLFGSITVLLGLYIFFTFLNFSNICFSLVYEFINQYIFFHNCYQLNYLRKLSETLNTDYLFIILGRNMIRNFCTIRILQLCYRERIELIIRGIAFYSNSVTFCKSCFKVLRHIQNAWIRNMDRSHRIQLMSLIIGYFVYSRSYAPGCFCGGFAFRFFAAFLSGVLAGNCARFISPAVPAAL